MLIKYPYIIIGFTPVLLLFSLIVVMLSLPIILAPIIAANNTEFTSAYDFMKNSTVKSTLFIYPQYTYYANEENSLADIDTDVCKSCGKYPIFDYTFWEPVVKSGKGLPFINKDTVSLYLGGVSDTGGTSIYNIGYRYFNITNDNSVNMKPEILKDFDRIVLMRNVYVTETLRQSILSHDNVIYLFPDVMTKQITVQNMTSAQLIDGKIKIANVTMQYVREYPPLHDMVPVWIDDNRCEYWAFVPVQNGFMMNCVPDVAIINNKEMLLALRDISTR